MHPMTFDELHIQIGGIFCGVFEGTAYLSGAGQVTAVELKGYSDHWRDRARPASIDFIVRPGPPDPTQRDAFLIRIIADEIEKQYAADIRETLAEAREAMPWRPTNLGPSQAQRS